MRLTRIGVALATTLVACFLVTSAVQAQGGRRIDLQLFQPPPSPGSTFLIDRPQVPRHLSFVVGLGSSFALSTLQREVDGEAENLQAWLWQTEGMFSLGLFEAMELGVVVPFALASVAEDATASTLTYGTVASLADIRLLVKVPILRGDFSLSGRAVMSLPTGDDEELLGNGYWTLMPSAVAAYTSGALTIAGELGYRLRRSRKIGNLEQDDEIQLSVGGAYAFSESLSAILDVQARVGILGDPIRSNQMPVEASAGVRITAAPGVTFDIGAGTGPLSGALPGYGVPTARFFGIARFASENEPCAAGPEDYDGYLDGDFCADLDNDADGIVDTDDECPNDAEDRDGFLDDDGCPEADNDADGVVDGEDQCPVESEDRDGFEDQNGCPELDNDSDGILDGVDECPMEPEDTDQFQDDDGCPEPGPDTPVVTLTDTRILISERVYFDFDADTIRSVSMPLLNQVATVIRDLSAGSRVRVEGYTDDAGNAAYNLDLSFRRARAVVEYLVSRGIARDRLEYVGYGPRNPVAPNDTPEGQALNRRVDFYVVSAAAPPVQQPGRPRRPRPPATPAPTPAPTP